MGKPEGLSTTSYAILGQLALQDWTMYDLARQMRRNVHYFFPRVESQVYAEPKRLVALGLATMRRESTGRRSRTVYAITGEGRRALADWLAMPVSRPPLLEFEGLLRVFLSPFGTEADLCVTLSEVRRDIAGLLELADRISDEYLEGRAPFQRHVLVRSMVHDFLFSFGVLVDQWAERSLARAEAWPTQSRAERIEAAREVFVKGRRAPRRGTDTISDTVTEWPPDRMEGH
jgi:DNA-binding PadR family transcriptional regulator